MAHRETRRYEGLARCVTGSRRQEPRREDIAESRSAERSALRVGPSLSIDEADAQRQVRGGHHGGRERNVYTFVDGAETRTLEFGRLETGEAYVRETGRGDITQFCYDAPPARPLSGSARPRNTRSRTWRTRCESTLTTSSSATPPSRRTRSAPVRTPAPTASRRLSAGQITLAAATGGTMPTETLTCIGEDHVNNVRRPRVQRRRREAHRRRVPAAGAARQGRHHRPRGCRRGPRVRLRRPRAGGSRSSRSRPRRLRAGPSSTTRPSRSRRGSS